MDNRGCWRAGTCGPSSCSEVAPMILWLLLGFLEGGKGRRGFLPTVQIGEQVLQRAGWARVSLPEQSSVVDPGHCLTEVRTWSTSVASVPRRASCRWSSSPTNPLLQQCVRGEKKCTQDNKNRTKKTRGLRLCSLSHESQTNVLPQVSTLPGGTLLLTPFTFLTLRVLAALKATAPSGLLRSFLGGYETKQETSWF